MDDLGETYYFQKHPHSFPPRSDRWVNLLYRLFSVHWGILQKQHRRRHRCSARKEEMVGFQRGFPTAGGLQNKEKVSQNGKLQHNLHLGGGNSKIFWNFHPEKLGKMNPFWPYFFQMGWWKTTNQFIFSFDLLKLIFYGFYHGKLNIKPPFGTILFVHLFLFASKESQIHGFVEIQKVGWQVTSGLIQRFFRVFTGYFFVEEMYHFFLAHQTKPPL